MEYADIINSLATRYDLGSVENPDGDPVVAVDHNNQNESLRAIVTELGTDGVKGAYADLAARLVAFGDPRTEIRYVRTDGDDANDGLTPESPKATISAAVRSLTEEFGTVDTEDNTWFAGVVDVGPGTFTDESIPARAWLQVRGAGVGYGGTVISLADSATGWLFDVDADGEFPNEFVHFFQISDCILSGNATGAPSAGGILRTRNGGFCAAISDVVMVDSVGVGIKVEGFAVNYLLHNLSLANLKGGALVWDVTEDNGGIVWSGVTQIDQCGPSAIKVNLSADAGDRNGMHIGGILKTEAVDGDALLTDHKYIVDITPRPSPAIGGRFSLTGDVLDCSRWANPGEVGSRVVYERDHVSNPGTSGTFLSIRDIRGLAHYEKAAESELQGFATRGSVAHNVYWRGGWGSAAGDVDTAGGLLPYRERDGVQDWQGAGAPGAVVAPNGSTWLDEDTGTLYRRVSGAWHTVDTTAV